MRENAHNGREPKSKDQKVFPSIVHLVSAHSLPSDDSSSNELRGEDTSDSKISCVNLNQGQ